MLKKSLATIEFAVILRKSQIIFVMIKFVSIIVVSNGRQLTPLVCNSVNDLQELNEQTDLVYVTTRGSEYLHAHAVNFSHHLICIYPIAAPIIGIPTIMCEML